MNRPETPRLLLPIEDVQAGPDAREQAIDRVGVRGLRYPLTIDEGDAPAQATVGSWDLSIALPDHVRGAHMSRFVALLDERTEPFTPLSFGTFAGEVARRLEGARAFVEVGFAYFRRKVAPVSGVASLMDYEARLAAVADLDDAKPTAVELTVVVPVTSLCPCSKTISAYGAHNQRSHLTLTVATRDEVRLHELVDIAETEASCELYGVLKRPDEKYVTERAYDNPKFVEDLVRDVAGRLAADRRFARYRVEAENFESIHNHSAYAIIEGRHRG
jgi:GTP cyclohydrolase I